MSELEEVRAHRVELIAKVDAILKMYEDDKVENEARAKRYRITLVVLGLLVALCFWTVYGNYRNSNDIEAFVTCQAKFNNSVQAGNRVKSKASQEYSTSTLGYSQTLNDPTASIEDKAEAQRVYFDTLRKLIQAQQNNPTPEVSNCRLPD